MKSTVTWVLAAVAIAACTVGEEPQKSAPEQATTTPPRSDLALARALALPDARLTQTLAPASRFRQVATDYVSASPRADGVHVRLPTAGNAPIEFRAGRYTRPLAKVRVDGFDVESHQLEDGHVVQQSKTRGMTALWSAGPDILEQSLLLHDASAVKPVVWNIELRSDLIEARRESPSSIVFADSAGDVHLRVAAPVALAADGRRIPITVQFAAADADVLRGQLSFRFSTKGAKFPLLVDPFLETVTWSEKAINSGPPDRYGHAMAYDVARKRVVLFGGKGFSDDLADTWEWDGTAWKQISVVGPSKRRFHSMAYFDDGTSSGVLLHGGQQGTTKFPDTWLFDGTKWMQLSPAKSVGMRFGHAMAYIASLKQVLLFGGIDGGNNWKDETWVFDGKTWAQVTTGSAPVPLFSLGLVYNSKSDRAVLYGGRNSSVWDKTWEWSAVNKTWGEKLPPPPPGDKIPGELAGMGLSYDSRLDRVVLFGGDDGAVFTQKTWEFDGTNWEQRNPSTNPPSRTDTAMVYDAQRDRTVLFGGWVNTELDDTWEYRRFGGKCTTAAQCEGSACVDGVCCVQAQCNTCEACSPVDGKCAAVKGAPDPDSCGGAQACDSQGACKKANGEVCTGASECASGQCADGRCCNAACDKPCEACDVASSEGTCSFVTGEPRHGSCPGVGTCGASCDGQGAECSFTPKGSSCGSVCQNGVLSRSDCDGQGNCLALGSEACVNSFGCADAETCRTSCTEDAHCAGGATCNGGQCLGGLGGSICIDKFTTRDPSGTEVSCAGHVCAGGVCRETCSSSDECAPDFACKSSDCVRLRDEASDSTGCGCRTPPRGSGGAPFLSLLVVLLLARRRESRPTHQA